MFMFWDLVFWAEAFISGQDEEINGNPKNEATGQSCFFVGWAVSRASLVQQLDAPYAS